MCGSGLVEDQPEIVKLHSATQPGALVPVPWQPVLAQRTPVASELVTGDRSSAWLHAPPGQCLLRRLLPHQMPAQRLVRRCR